MRETLQILFNYYPFQMLLDKQRKIKTIDGACFEMMRMAYLLISAKCILIGSIFFDATSRGAVRLNGNRY